MLGGKLGKLLECTRTDIVRRLEELFGWCSSWCGIFWAQGLWRTLRLKGFLRVRRLCVYSNNEEMFFRGLRHHNTLNVDLDYNLIPLKDFYSDHCAKQLPLFHKNDPLAKIWKWMWTEARYKGKTRASPITIFKTFHSETGCLVSVAQKERRPEKRVSMLGSVLARWERSGYLWLLFLILFHSPKQVLV